MTMIVEAGNVISLPLQEEEILQIFACKLSMHVLYLLRAASGDLSIEDVGVYVKVIESYCPTFLKYDHREGSLGSNAERKHAFQ